MAGRGGIAVARKVIQHPGATSKWGMEALSRVVDGVLAKWVEDGRDSI